MNLNFAHASPRVALGWQASIAVPAARIVAKRRRVALHLQLSPIDYDTARARSATKHVVAVWALLDGRFETSIRTATIADRVLRGTNTFNGRIEVAREQIRDRQ